MLLPVYLGERLLIVSHVLHYEETSSAFVPSQYWGVLPFFSSQSVDSFLFFSWYWIVKIQWYHLFSKAWILLIRHIHVICLRHVTIWKAWQSNSKLHCYYTAATVQACFTVWTVFNEKSQRTSSSASSFNFFFLYLDLIINRLGNHV